MVPPTRITVQWRIAAVERHAAKAMSSGPSLEELQHCQIARTTCQVDGTALRWKQRVGTAGKLVGMVTIH
jgi:hypothetical protein